jgi:DtxR family Mn-dependent transcriptional regulator
MVVHPEFTEHSHEEILECIWCRREERGDMSISGLLEESRERGIRDILKALEDRRLIAASGDTVRLLPEGEERAKVVVRRHRLAERLLSDVFDLPLAESEQQACLMEHILSPSVTDAVCAFLGHPPTCPHGLPIPAGACCQARRNGSVKPLVMPLQELAPGASARIVFIAPSLHRRLDRLESFGVVPGTVLSLRQKRPSLVVELGGTTLALERDVADEIYVRHEDG